MPLASRAQPASDALSACLAGPPDFSQRPPEEARAWMLDFFAEDLRLGCSDLSDQERAGLIGWVATGAGPEPGWARFRAAPEILSRRWGHFLGDPEVQEPPTAEARRRTILTLGGLDPALTARALRLMQGLGLEVQMTPQSALLWTLKLARQAFHTAPEAAPARLSAQGLTRSAALAVFTALGGAEAEFRDLLIRGRMDVPAPGAPQPEAPGARLLAEAMDMAGFLEEFDRPEQADWLLRRDLNSIPWEIRAHLAGRPASLGALLDALLAFGPKNAMRQWVKKSAEDFLNSASPEVLTPLLIARLAAPEEATRRKAAARLIALKRPEADAALQAHQAQEKSVAVRRLIEAGLAGQAARAESAAVGAEDDAEGYTAIGGARIAIPPVRPLPSGPRPVFGAEDEAELVALIEARNADLRRRHEESLSRNPKSLWPLRLINPAWAADEVAELNGGPRPTRSDGEGWSASEFFSFMRRSEPGAVWLRARLRRLPPREGLLHVRRNPIWLHDDREDPGFAPMAAYLKRPDADLRALEALAIETGETIFVKDKGSRPVVPGDLLAYLLKGDPRPTDYPRDFVWPLVAANLEVIAAALGAPSELWPKLSRREALQALALLPATPRRFFGPLMEIAASPLREDREAARALLEAAPGVDERLLGMLKETRSELRLTAAGWLARRRRPETEAPLRAALKTEKAQAVRAALIDALRRMGADVSDLAGREALTREAEAGARRPLADPPGWLDPALISGLRWRDGSPLPETVARWWIHLTLRLKQPGGDGMVALWLDALDPRDAERLGLGILAGWLEEGARSQVNDYTFFQTVSRGNEGGAQKGLLALALKAPESFVGLRARAYLKTHAKFAANCMSLLEHLAGRDDFIALQLLLEVSEKQKQSRVRALAGELILRLAAARGWTPDQLADRAVSDAGLDAQGRLELSLGAGRRYVARLDEKLDLALFNAEGRKVKALPAAEGEEADEARKIFAAARKTLKASLALQADRLRDAMRAERIWETADWSAVFSGHPVMRKLAERLVWLGLDAEGAVLSGFRPTPEGDAVGLDDAPVDLARFAGVKLAHGALIGEEADALWAAHLKDYDVVSPFPQFGMKIFRAPEGSGEDAWVIRDLPPFGMDDLALRALATKLGYRHGAIGDGGGIARYQRRAPGSGLLVVLDINGGGVQSGGYVVDVVGMRFARDLGDLRLGSGVPLAEVPPALLSDAWREYHVFAGARKPGAKE